MERYVRRRVIDRFARWVITGGGLIVIASILAMLTFLVYEAAPLWERPSLHELDAPRRAPGPVAIGTNEYREVGFVIDDDGSARAWSLGSGEILFESLIAGDSLRVTAARPTDPEAGEWMLGTETGSALLVRFDAGLGYVDGDRTYDPRFDLLDPISFGDAAVEAMAHATSIDGRVVAGVLADGRVVTVVREVTESLLGGRTIEDTANEIPLPDGTRATAVALDYQGRHLYVGTERGAILEWSVASPGTAPVGTYQAVAHGAVTHLGTLLGGQSLVVGGADGAVSVWFRARAGAEEALHLIQAHRFDAHPDAVVGSAASPRNRSLVTWDRSGTMELHFATTAETRLRESFEAPIHALVWTPKSDGIVVSDGDGVAVWQLDDPHPEASTASLFGAVHYEGYVDADRSWQSTGSTDETEPKLSLVPLIFGTLKGTLYAMALSAPVAILAALYTAVFMRPGLRGLVKPVMELMATLPSVVLGLLAGLWLAPRLQNAMPIALVSLIFLAVPVLVVGWLRTGPLSDALRRMRAGTEVLVLVPILAGSLALVLALNGAVDGLFDGGFLHWLYEHFEIRYDQRNALVVGIAMGLAVVPIIFSVSEDALSTVPRHLTAGSLALGASPWQTAWRVVLPAASPGIFSALMIGFGRAVGETMIMLMATGNTPIMDWSLFNGFRTLSANIAVEIPEAPHGGTLYRVLFLSALLLFVFTLFINTTAEVVRNRLRARYSRF